jgi:hypothetical protein
VRAKIVSGTAELEGTISGVVAADQSRHLDIRAVGGRETIQLEWRGE